MQWLLLALAMVGGDAMSSTPPTDPPTEPPAALPADPLAEADARFGRLDSYRVTLRAVSADGTRQDIRYAWRRPGWIRMDFVEPHAGAVMIHNPDTHRVHLSPFGADTMPTLDLAPDNFLIRSPRGHSVDRSDVGALLHNLAELRARGSMSAPVADEAGSRPAIRFEIEGGAGVSVAGVHRYRVWLDRNTLFPLRVQSHDAARALIETVDMHDAELDVALPERLFAP